MKTRKIYTSLMLSGMILICGACGDFLEERSQNMAYVENVGDLDELLIGEGYLPGGYSLDEETDAKTNSNWTKITQTTPSYFPYIHLMDDDATEYLIGSMGNSEKNYIRLKAGNLHHWQPDPFFDSNNTAFEDKNWSECWKRIAAMNSIVYQVGGNAWS